MRHRVRTTDSDRLIVKPVKSVNGIYPRRLTLEQRETRNGIAEVVKSSALSLFSCIQLIPPIVKPVDFVLQLLLFLPVLL